MKPILLAALFALLVGPVANAQSDSTKTAPPVRFRVAINYIDHVLLPSITDLKIDFRKPHLVEWTQDSPGVVQDVNDRQTATRHNAVPYWDRTISVQSVVTAYPHLNNDGTITTILDMTDTETPVTPVTPTVVVPPVTHRLWNIIMSSPSDKEVDVWYNFLRVDPSNYVGTYLINGNKKRIVCMTVTILPPGH